jgi:hypothetical protein
MPGITTNGLPYPINTDRLTDGAAKIQELAEAVDTKILAAWTIVPATWTAATTMPNKGATGVCEYSALKRGHAVDFGFVLRLLGAGIALGSGNYSFGLPYAADLTHYDKFSYAGITNGPNVQFTVRLTSAGNMILYKNGASSQYGSAQAATDGWASGTVLAISGTYLAA